jgi:hypothetical protein
MSLGDWVISASAIGIGVYTYKIIQTKYDKKMLWVGIIVFLLADFGLHKILDQPVPSAFFEKGKYQAKIFVFAFPEGSTVKSYKVPASIERDSERNDVGEDNYGQTIFTTDYFYRINKLYMPNGGVIEFEEDNFLDSNLKGELRDSQGHYWKIEITKEVAK